MLAKAVKTHGSLQSAPFDEAIAGAIKALVRGDAEPYQQRLALNWIIEHACGFFDVSFTPGDQGMTDFNEGRRFVAKQIGEISRTNMSLLIEQLRRKDVPQK